MPAERRKPKNSFRRVERWMIGVVFAVVAFVLERVVMRSVKRGGTKPVAAEPEPTTIRTSGAEAAIHDPADGRP
jgi:hypothetical protein